MQLPSVMPILGLEVEQFSWMMLAALAVRLILQIVLEALLYTVDMATEMMLEYDVKVWENDTVQLQIHAIATHIVHTYTVYTYYYI